MGVPWDEMILAKMLHSAKERGLKATRGAFYRDSKGVWTDRKSAAVECCAAGAWMLDERSDAPPNVVHGNDGHVLTPTMDATGYTIGAAFQEAMSDE